MVVAVCRRARGPAPSLPTHPRATARVVVAMDYGEGERPPLLPKAARPGKERAGS